MQVAETLQLRRDRAPKGGRTIIDGDDDRVLRMSAAEQKKWLDRYHKGEGLLDEYVKIAEKNQSEEARAGKQAGGIL